MHCSHQSVTLLIAVGLFSGSLLQQAFGSGDIRIVIQENDLTPGDLGGAVFASFGTPQINNAGQTAFSARLSGNGIDESNDASLWSEGTGILAKVAREGAPAPGLPSGAVFEDVHTLRLAANGQTAFKGSTIEIGTHGPFLTEGIWSDNSGAVELIAREGAQVPGMPNEATFTSFDSVRPLLDALGNTTFSARMIGSGIDFNNDVGIWSNASGSLELEVQEGDQAPGRPTGVKIRVHDSLVVTANGESTLRGFLFGNGISAENNMVVLSEATGMLSLVAQEGDHAPGTPSEIRFAGFKHPKSNSSGHTAFLGELEGTGSTTVTNDEGIWSDRTGTATAQD